MRWRLRISSAGQPSWTSWTGRPVTSTVRAIDLPFDEAIDFLRKKTNVTSEGWTDVLGAANATSFTVAGAGTQALVGDFRKEVAKALTAGTSLGDFRKEFDAIVERYGWEHNGSPGWRARVIFETNLSTAYAAGRFAQMTEPETLAAYPYWQYVHSGAAHPRKQHQAWDGLTLRADDPFWETHYPPNGWGCGCRVRPVSARRLQRMGKSGPDTAPAIARRDVVDRRTGEVHSVPEGIDLGWDYNVGRAAGAGPVQMPANATLRPPTLATLDDMPAAARATVEDFANRVLSGEINDPARSLYAASLPSRLAAHLPGGSGNIELSAFRILKIAGRASEMAGRASSAHPEVTANIWGRLQVMLQEGEAFASTRHGWPGIEVVHTIDGSPYVAVIRRVLRPDGSARLDIPTLHRINPKRLAQMRAGRHGRVKIEK